MEKGIAKEKLSSTIDERKYSKFRNDHTMTIVGIPDVVVLELVDVHVELTIVVEVHVGNENV